MRSNIMADLLFIENTSVASVARYINATCFKFVIAFLILGVIIELFSDCDFRGLIKRTFLALFVFATFEMFLVQGVNISFEFSSKIIKKFSPNNALVVGWQKSLITARKMKAMDKIRDRKITFWDRMVVLAKTVYTDSLSFLTWVFTYVAFILLQNIYSLLYNLLYAFMGLAALLSILKWTAKSLVGAFNTYLVLLITPVVAAIIIILMGENVEFAVTSEGTIVTNIQALIQLCITAIVLLLSPVMASALLFGTGLHEVGNQIARMAAMSQFIGLQSVLVNRAKRMIRYKYNSALFLAKRGMEGVRLPGRLASRGVHRSSQIKSPMPSITSKGNAGSKKNINQSSVLNKSSSKISAHVNNSKASGRRQKKWQSNLQYSSVKNQDRYRNNDQTKHVSETRPKDIKADPIRLRPRIDTSTKSKMQNVSSRNVVKNVVLGKQKTKVSRHVLPQKKKEYRDERCKKNISNAYQDVSGRELKVNKEMRNEKSNK